MPSPNPIIYILLRTGTSSLQQQRSEIDYRGEGRGFSAAPEV